VKRLLLLASLFLGFTAHAGVMLEPYVGYSTGDVKFKAVAAGSREYADTTANLAFGARVGYKFMIPWVAVDYTSESGKATADKKLAGNTDYDYSKTGIGAVVGADIPMGLRVWGGYGFSDSFTDKGTSGAADIKYTGTYTKGGLGFKFIPKLSVNAEYVIHTYTKAKNSITGAITDVKSSYSTFNHDTIMVTISAPFSF
jgi:hypothetical protein